MFARLVRYPRLGMGVVLMGLALAAFAPVLGNGFVLWDDYDIFLNNPHYRGLGWEQIRWTWGAVVVGTYNPLGWMLHAAEYQMSGLNPLSYHAVSLVLHAVNAVVLWLVIVALLRRARPDLAARSPGLLHACAAFGAAFYAVHPLRTEVVAWASAQPYIPCVLCCLLSLLTYLRAHDGVSSRLRWLAMSWLLYGAALLFKALAVPLPFVFVILDFYPLRRWELPRGWRRCLIEKLPFLLVTAVFMVLTMRIREGVIPMEKDGVLWRLGLACYSVGFYLSKTLWPRGLAYLYGLPPTLEEQWMLFGVSAAVVLVITAACWLLRRRWPALFAAWAAYLVILAPNSGFVRSCIMTVNDRYAYACGLSLAVLLAGGVWLLLHRLELSRRSLLRCSLAAGCLVVALARASWFQSLTWRNSGVMWGNAMISATYPHPTTRANFAETLIRNGWHEPALNLLDDAVAIHPDEAYLVRGYGSLLLDRGRAEEALPHLLRLDRLRPNDPLTVHLLGRTFAALKRREEAREQFQLALRLKPDLAEARQHLKRLQKQRDREADDAPIK